MPYKTIENDGSNPIEGYNKIRFSANGQIGDTNKKHTIKIYYESELDYISNDDWIIVEYPKDNIRMNE